MVALFILNILGGAILVAVIEKLFDIYFEFSWQHIIYLVVVMIWGISIFYVTGKI